MSSDTSMFVLTISKNDYEIPAEGIHLCKFFSTQLTLDPNTREFHIPDVQLPIAEKLVSYLRYHSTVPTQSIPVPLPASNLVGIVDNFDLQFVECDLHTLSSLILVANFLGCSSLSDLTLAKLASMMMGKTQEELCSLLGVNSNVSQDELSQVKSKYKHILDQL